MTRSRLPNRRLSITTCVSHNLANGNKWSLLITYGINSAGLVQEAFCASFKSGMDMEVLAVDASILLSRLLQYGDTLEAIVKTLGEPPSIIKTIAAHGLSIERELQCNPTHYEHTSVPQLSPSFGTQIEMPLNFPATSKSDPTDSNTTPPPVGT